MGCSQGAIKIKPGMSSSQVLRGGATPHHDCWQAGVLAGCWPETSVSCHVDLIRRPTTQQLDSIRTSKQRDKAGKTEARIFVIILDVAAIAPPIFLLTEVMTKSSSHSTGGKYTGASIHGNKDVMTSFRHLFCASLIYQIQFSRFPYKSSVCACVYYFSSL